MGYTSNGSGTKYSAKVSMNGKGHYAGFYNLDIHLPHFIHIGPITANFSNLKGLISGSLTDIPDGSEIKPVSKLRIDGELSQRDKDLGREPLTPGQIYHLKKWLQKQHPAVEFC